MIRRPFDLVTTCDWPYCNAKPTDSLVVPGVTSGHYCARHAEARIAQLREREKGSPQFVARAPAVGDKP